MFAVGCFQADLPVSGIAISVFDRVDVGQQGAAYSEEVAGIENRFEFIQGEVDKIALTGIEMRQHAFVPGLETGDIADRYRAQAMASRDQQAGLVAITQPGPSNGLFLLLCRGCAQSVQLVEGLQRSADCTTFVMVGRLDQRRDLTKWIPLLKPDRNRLSILILNQTLK